MKQQSGPKYTLKINRFKYARLSSSWKLNHPARIPIYKLNYYYYIQHWLARFIHSNRHCHWLLPFAYRQYDLFMCEWVFLFIIFFIALYSNYRVGWFIIKLKTVSTSLWLLYYHVVFDASMFSKFCNKKKNLKATNRS